MEKNNLGNILTTTQQIDSMNLKITQMSSATAISGSEFIPIVQDGINKRTSIDDLKIIMANSLPTISDLKNRPGRLSNETIDILGYYTRFDGGGGKYYWNSTSTAYAGTEVLRGM